MRGQAVSFDRMGHGYDAGRLSPHKLSGAGLSGRADLAPRRSQARPPDQPGRTGTVRFVIPLGAGYAADVVRNERKQGTPNVIGDIAPALCFIVKEAIGEARMARDPERASAQSFGRRVPKTCQRLTYSGLRSTPRLAHFFHSWFPRSNGRIVHPNFVCRILSDHFGTSSHAADVCLRRPLCAPALLGSTGRSRIACARKLDLAMRSQKARLDPAAFSVLMDDAKVILSPRAVVPYARNQRLYRPPTAVEVVRRALQSKSATSCVVRVGFTLPVLSRSSEK